MKGVLGINVCAENSLEVETPTAWKLSQMYSEYVQMFDSYDQINPMWYLNTEVDLAGGRSCIHKSNICCFTDVVSCIIFCCFSEKTWLVLCVNTSLHFFFLLCLICASFGNQIYVCLVSKEKRLKLSLPWWRNSRQDSGDKTFCVSHYTSPGQSQNAGRTPKYTTACSASCSMETAVILGWRNFRIQKTQSGGKWDFIF